MKTNIILAAMAAAALSLLPLGALAQDRPGHPSAPTEAPDGKQPQAPLHRAKGEVSHHKGGHRGPHAAPPRHSDRHGHGPECRPDDRSPAPPECRHHRPVPPPPCRHHRPAPRPAPRPEPAPAPAPGTVRVVLPGLTINVGV